MIRTKVQADRHVAILEALRAGGLQTVEGLRRHLLARQGLEVAVATIRRDLLVLEMAGSVVRRRGALPGHGYGHDGGRPVRYDGWEVVKG